MVVEVTAHKLCMIYRYTESEAFYIIDVCYIFQQRGHNMVSTAVGHSTAEGVDMLQLALLIAAGRPLQCIQIHGIGNAKILERTQKFAVDGFRQANFRRNAIVKVRQNTLAIHTLRGSGQPKQDTRLIVSQQLLIGWSCCVVELVYNDVIVEILSCFCREVLGVEGLNGDEQIVDAFGLIAAHKHFSKIGVLEHSPEGIQALF